MEQASKFYQIYALIDRRRENKTSGLSRQTASFSHLCTLSCITRRCQRPLPCVGPKNPHLEVGFRSNDSPRAAKYASRSSTVSLEITLEQASKYS